jgi:uncharacterized protein (DUF2267 family)
VASTGRQRDAARDYEAFTSMVARWGALGREEAARTTQAVLSTLAERLSAGEARDLVEQLPLEL